MHVLMMLVVPILLLGCDLIRGPSTPAVTLAPTKTFITVERIEQKPTDFKDQWVSIRGSGVTVITAPLCPGYVGMDTRYQFIDAEEKSMVARWQPAELPIQRTSSLRTFGGYIRIFEGQAGCPGSVGNVMFPYFEIVSIE